MSSRSSVKSEYNDAKQKIKRECILPHRDLYPRILLFVSYTRSAQDPFCYVGTRMLRFIG
jgi:hypothetical protein